MWKTKHHTFANRFFKPLMRPVLFRKNHFKSKVYKLDKNKSYIILSNHQTTWDPLLLYCSFKNLIYPVMAKEFIPLKYRPFVYKYVGPILKAKTLKDINAVKNMLTVIKEGGSFYLYPEGNRTFSGELCYIGNNLIKLLKKANADIVFYNFHGGFGFDPRYSTTHRKGNFYGELRSILSHEEVLALSDEELLEKIKQELTVIEAPTPYTYKSEQRAEALERALYRCPICHQIGTLHSKGNDLSCECGLKVTYNEHLCFESDNKDFKYKTVAEWFKDQENYIRGYQYEEGKVIFSDKETILEKLYDDHNDLITTGTLTLTDSTITINDLSFDYKDIIEMTVSSKQTLIFYVNQDMYRVSSNVVGFNPIKYMQMYYHITHMKNNLPDDFLGI